jgi:hypothetical protein
MSNEESSAPAAIEPKKSSSWDWLGPSLAAIAAVFIVRLFGLVGALVTFGMYYWLKPKLGTWGAVTVAGIVGVVAALALGAMLRA